MALTWVVQCVDKVNTEGEFSDVCKKIGWVVMEDDQSISKNNIAFKTGVTPLNKDHHLSHQSLPLEFQWRHYQ